MSDLDRAHWSRVARQWIAWARSPNHDAFWAYREALAAFVGPGGGEALEVGCGEGRVSRELKTLGYRVVASDIAAEMVAAATDADSAHHYVVADATSLPFNHERFDLIVAYNVLMDVVDVPAVLTELARVMRPDGRLIISIVHPFADRGAFAGPEPDAFSQGVNPARGGAGRGERHDLGLHTEGARHRRPADRGFSAP